MRPSRTACVTGKAMGRHQRQMTLIDICQVDSRGIRDAAQVLTAFSIKTDALGHRSDSHCCVFWGQQPHVKGHCACLQVLTTFSIDTDALGLLSRCAKCNGEFEDRCGFPCAVVSSDPDLLSFSSPDFDDCHANPMQHHSAHETFPCITAGRCWGRSCRKTARCPRPCASRRSSSGGARSPKQFCRRSNYAIQHTTEAMLFFLSIQEAVLFLSAFAFGHRCRSSFCA